MCVPIHACLHGHAHRDGMDPSQEDPRGLCTHASLYIHASMAMPIVMEWIHHKKTHMTCAHVRPHTCIPHGHAHCGGMESS